MPPSITPTLIPTTRPTRRWATLLLRNSRNRNRSSRRRPNSLPLPRPPLLHPNARGKAPPTRARGRAQRGPPTLRTLVCIIADLPPTFPDLCACLAVDMHKKRTKTQRACDSCRARKIRSVPAHQAPAPNANLLPPCPCALAPIDTFSRCDVLSDTEPPLCQHCKQYGFECTFFLPITETRFKKKRLEEEAAAAAAAEKDKTAEPEGVQPSPKPETTRNVRIDGKYSLSWIFSLFPQVKECQKLKEVILGK